MQNVAASCRLITEDTQVVVAASINDEADDDTDDGPDDPDDTETSDNTKVPGLFVHYSAMHKHR